MKTAQLGDNEIFGVRPESLLDAIRDVSAGLEPDTVCKYLLVRCGLVESNLTDAGEALFKLAWVVRKEQEAEKALGQAMRRLDPLQVIEQELRGFGAVSEEGVLDLLRYHRSIPADLSITGARSLFRWLNKVGVIAYSSKLKTVRSLAPAPDSALAGEVASIAAMVSPKTPYRNIVRLRRILRNLRGIVWWADPHFGARALEELAEELSHGEVDEVRIVSGDADNVLTDRSKRDFLRFQQEMQNKEVAAEWRVDRRSTRDWHDRWIADSKSCWNVPPINTLLKNDYSEIVPTSEPPPFDVWWSRAGHR